MKNLYSCILGLFCLIQTITNAQTIIYQQNFDGNNGSYTNTIVSEGGTNGWRASSTAAQYGNYRHMWNFSNNISGGNANVLPISGRSLGMGFYNGNNPNVTNQPFRTWDGANCSVIPTTTRWAHVGLSTVGYENITVEFKWRCLGEVGGGIVYDYGTINTSIDGGSTWLMDQTGGQGGTTGAHGTFPSGLYYGNSGVQTTTLTLPATRNNQANFRLAFRMVVDQCDGTGGGFIVDDIIVRGTPLATDRTLTVAQAYTGATYANGPHVFANNASVTATSGTRAGYNVTGWTGTGSVPATGTGGSATFTIAQNSSITWQWQQVGVPTNVSFSNTGGSEQLTFNNSSTNTTTPVFRMSHATDPATDYQVEINTNPTFSGGTSWTQTFTGTYPINTAANFSFTNSFTPSDNTTYYVRARVRGAANVWSSWSTETYSFTHTTSATTPSWLQTTQAQLATATHSGTLANSSNNIVLSSGGGNVVTNGSFETGTTGWTILKPSWFTVASEPYGNTQGANALNIYNSNPSSFGNFNGDAAGAYQSLNMNGISNISLDAGYEATGGSAFIAQLRVYVSETNQTGYTDGTLVHTWTPNSTLTTGNAININVESYGFTGNKLLKIIMYFTGNDYAERYLYLDNVQAIASPNGTATSTPIYLASVQNVTEYGELKWNQTLNGGNVALKIQQYNGSTWADVAGYTNITASGDGEKTHDLSGMTAYDQIRLVATLSGTSTVTLHDWAVEFENPCTAAIDSVSNGSGCGAITLEAEGSTSTTEYRWYDAEVGGNLVDTTTIGEWTTPVLTQTTTYYVSSYNGECESARVAVTATFTPTDAEIIFTEGASTCEPGNVTLFAETSNDGIYTVNWYDAETGGNLVHTGFTYTVSLAQTTLFYVAAAEGSCESERIEITATINSKTWNGSVSTDWNTGDNWTPSGVPTSSNCVVIADVTNAPILSTGNEGFAKSLTLLENASLLVQSEATLTVTETVNLAVDAITEETLATFTIENDGYLVQTQNTATNSNVGKISVNKNSNPMFRLEATGWGSPVENQKLYDFAVGTVFGRVYFYDETANAFSASGIATNSVFELGRGYSVRAPNTYNSYNETATPTVFEGLFYGRPNNGDIGINVTANNLGYNYVGNPYPSPIDAEEFLSSNSNVASLHFWTHEAPPIDGEYAANNYASFTTMGGTMAAAGGEEPDGIIQVGQGFVIKAEQQFLLQFTNDLRIPNSNGQFFRSADTEKHRMWLNLNDSTTNYNQILLGYVENATMAVDHQIDAKLFGYSDNSIYSLIDNEKYVIQGRSLPFDVQDVVPLGFKATHAGTFTINISKKDGLFENDQIIYLRDLNLGIIHNLSEADYTFLTEIGTFENRFEIVYQNEPLSIDETSLNNSNWIVYKDNVKQTITVESKGFEINEIEIYDLTGRLLLNQKDVNSDTFICQNNFADQVLLVKINKTLVKKAL
ncbi:hypothetical protein M0M57_04160 [Flavobacterium azooxidireducens]|uniref:Ig-like domain-containing protein n=1 Tax=Flavobacterium azooxidireducens TaxID=1871076 RepID=A0ABY4KGV4_9FLAO|nr:hypothetical protein [Flavobacterium azooxidireducens]UPQ80034.1 hypothetical protein M0M57_04160 [Flavobacterium azooxidireducens]